MKEITLNQNTVNVSDAVYDLIRQALINATPADFSEFDCNTEGTNFRVDGNTINFH